MKGVGACLVHGRCVRLVCVFCRSFFLASAQSCRTKGHFQTHRISSSVCRHAWLECRTLEREVKLLSCSHQSKGAKGFLCGISFLGVFPTSEHIEKSRFMLHNMDSVLPSDLSISNIWVKIDGQAIGFRDRTYTELGIWESQYPVFTLLSIPLRESFPLLIAGRNQ